MTIKKAIRAALGFCVVAAPLAMLGCDEPKSDPAKPAGGANPGPAPADAKAKK